MPWYQVGKLDELAAGQPKLVVVSDEDIALYRVRDEVYATEDLCSHAEASLAEGDQDGYTIHCPRHGGQFDIRTGKATHFPAYAPIRTFAVKVEDGDIFVEAE